MNSVHETTIARVTKSLIGEEGTVLDNRGKHKVYLCSAGKRTIGYGHNLDAAGLCDAAVNAQLEHDIDQCVKRLTHSLPCFFRLPEEQRGVLIEMVFQLGWGTFATFKKMLKALELEDFEEAAKEALDSKWAKHDSPARAYRMANRLRQGARK